MRYVIFQDEHFVWKFFGTLHLNLLCLDVDCHIRRDSCIVLFQASPTICACFKTVYTVAKLVPQPSIMGQYPNFHYRTTAGFKIDWYPPSWKLAKCSQEKFHASLGSLASCVKAPQLYQCSDLQRGVCYHPLGVIFYNYTTKKLRFSRKQVCH